MHAPVQDKGIEYSTEPIYVDVQGCDYYHTYGYNFFL